MRINRLLVYCVCYRFIYCAEVLLIAYADLLVKDIDPSERSQSFDEEVMSQVNEIICWSLQ